jgi:dihydrofolate reductase
MNQSREPVVNRVLLTRIVCPDFDDCDVFMPNFLSEALEIDRVSFEWRRASHEELQNWVGFDVATGIQEEKGVQYEFQMWVR